MPVVTVHTEQSLADYMKSTLKEVATDLGWLDTTPVTGNYVRPVNVVEQQLRVADIVDSTAPTRHIELVSDVAIWTEALGAYVRAYAAGGIQRNLQRQQLFDHCRVMLLEAQTALAAYMNEVVAETVGEGKPLYSMMVPLITRF